MPKLADVLFDDLRSSKKNINRIFSAGLLFAFIAHFYVVEPYFEYDRKEKTISESLIVEKRYHEELSSQPQKIIALSQGIDKLLDDFKQNTNNLPSKLNKIVSENIQFESSAAGGVRGYYRRNIVDEDDGYYPSGVTTPEDAVSYCIDNWFNKLINKLKDDLLALVKVSEITRNGDEYVNQAVDDIEEDFKGLEPGFWKYLDDENKGKVGIELQQAVESSIEVVRGWMSELKNKINDKIKNVNVSMNEIEKKQNKYNESKDKLNSRINSLQSPIGQIPVELREMIKLLPIILVGLLIAITVNLRKYDCLRIALQQELKKNSKTNINEGALQQFVFCWYLPPYKSIFPPVVLWFCIVFIICFFIRTVALIIPEYELFIHIDSDKVNYLMRNLFVSSYILGSMSILVCLWFIRRVINNTHSKT